MMKRGSSRRTRGFLLVWIMTALTGCGRYPEDIIPDLEAAANPWTRIDRDLASLPLFRFAVVADRTGGLRHGVFDRAVTHLNRLQPDFVLSIGDLITGYTEDQIEINRQWAAFDSLVHGLTMPFFYLPGNHDLTNPVLRETWKRRYGREYYYFTYKNTLFLCLNTEDSLVRSGQDTLPTFGTRQISLVRDALKRHPRSRWTFVFMHRPLWIEKDHPGWQELSRLLGERNVTVFAGHFHRYCLFTREGRRLFLLGTTGGGKPGTDISQGLMDHLLWVSMTHKGPLFTNLLLDGIHDETVRVDTGAGMDYHARDYGKPVP